MTFLEVLEGGEVISRAGNPNVTGLQYDSRKIKSGDVFVAVRGETADGNKFIDVAIASGAAAVVTDSPEEAVRPQVAWAVVVNGRRALARLSANLYGHPATRLALTGITGTNGKSTSAFLVESILAAAGRKCALFGTIEYHIAGKILAAPHTTPESLELNRLLSDAVEDGAAEAVLEVSSHALTQERVNGFRFDVAVFTNLTRDHLDYHSSMDAYFAAKQRLFQGCGADPPRAAVVNVDDEYGRRLLEMSTKLNTPVFTYGLKEGNFHAGPLEVTQSGARFDLVAPDGNIPIHSKLVAKVNVHNMLAAAAAAYARGCDLPAIARGISNLRRVPGRFERVDCGQPFTVAVDYAHTDDALRNLTALARDFVNQQNRGGRVITVFGCGGDRDRSKRPLMGEAAGRGSDFVVLTSDNPRGEDPLAIINDALVGLQRCNAKYRIEPDRKTAIAIAIREASAADIVLIAGKGHEKVQVTGQGSLPFNDVEVAEQMLHDAGYDCESHHAIPAKS
ncbi:MAG: UDP-N-acetylmuramoyl-L-alanyl-D-glutamate--2,6-diaminopimelate ligase [Acidobacteriales bacterium]|nr:UDP-N-acetylmuramoyl-L-alanyl-D-glutamate--2,6-diaminopimelate ligase [Terriglobales bacterium]